MKFMKKSDYAGTVRKIVSDDRGEVLGVLGTFKDLMELGIVEDVTEYSYDTWCCIPDPGRIERWDGIGATRKEAVRKAIFGRKL